LRRSTVVMILGKVNNHLMEQSFAGDAGRRCDGAPADDSHSWRTCGLFRLVATGNDGCGCNQAMGMFFACPPLLGGGSSHTPRPKSCRLYYAWNIAGEGPMPTNVLTFWSRFAHGGHAVGGRVARGGVLSRKKSRHRVGRSLIHVLCQKWRKRVGTNTNQHPRSGQKKAGNKRCRRNFWLFQGALCHEKY
jgi:hypothetical protein